MSLVERRMARRRPGDAPDMSAEPPTANILALHGFTGVGADFAPFAEMYGSIWHCPNLPGHGSEPSLDCTPEATNDYIQTQASALRSQVSGLRSQVSALSPQPSILLGYSMGARAALQLACKKPRAWDALILISPNPGIEDETERSERRAVDEKLAQRIERDGVHAFIKFWQSTPMIRSQKNIRADWRAMMQANRTRHTAHGLAGSLRQFGQGSCPNLWPELNTLNMPTLLITGGEDIKYTRIAERMLPSLPHGTLKIIDDAGHMPHLENPQVCADAIKAFLSNDSQFQLQ